MTPDELITRVHQQRADQAAVQLALDALMLSLPPEARQQWLAALRTLQATRAEALQTQGVSALAASQANQAIERQAERLERCHRLAPAMKPPQE